MFPIRPNFVMSLPVIMLDNRKRLNRAARRYRNFGKGAKQFREWSKS